MRLNSSFFNKIGKMLDFYSQFNPSPLSIKQFLDFGKSINFHKFLHDTCKCLFKVVTQYNENFQLTRYYYGTY